MELDQEAVMRIVYETMEFSQLGLAVAAVELALKRGEEAARQVRTGEILWNIQGQLDPPYVFVSSQKETTHRAEVLIAVV